jgi:4a-hydroxytetrahydrobiopterin dehydratase
MKPLAKRKGSPTKDSSKALKGKDLAKYKKQLKGGWKVVRGHHLEKEYKFKDFRTALAYTNKVGRAAETQGHHPDVFLAWGKVKLTIWDHHTDGLIEADFVLAAKADRAYG